MRYFIEISFNGSNYHGWQIQPNAISVQEVIEKTMSTLVRKPIKITGAGRTDAGVHAKQLFAHFDCTDEIKDLKDVQFKLNAFLPNDISILVIFPVKQDAHARFDASARTYEYKISLSKNPFVEGFAYQIKNVPDVSLMNKACAIIMQYSNFKCFSRMHTDVKTFNCQIKEANWQEKEDILLFTITADRFLRNMVRAIVGTLLDVGLGKKNLNSMHQIIESRDRSKAGASAPAYGLYLTKVEYPEHILL